jgi:benzoyl-CoA reductase/2-hydroxyglutaryl-CoA dehydratase subunit BcrC/BadD/HgdB
MEADKARRLFLAQIVSCGMIRYYWNNWKVQMLMKKSIYKEFLRIAGFEKEEINEYLPEWIAASKKLGITEEDMYYAVREWLPQHWNLKSEGVRKCIGVYIREVFEITKIDEYKQKGIKIVYGILPAFSVNFQAIKMSGGNKVFVSFPDINILTVLGSFFHKSSAFIEKAEKCNLQTGCRHCGLVKTRLGARMINFIPSPDVIWSWGLTCNEGPKMDEFIKCYLDSDWHSVFINIPHDTYLGEVEDELPDRVEYLAAQIQDGQEQIEKIIGIHVSEQDLRKSLEDVNRFIRNVHYLNDLVLKADPQPLSGSELSLFGQLMTGPINIGSNYVEEAVDIAIEEVKSMINRKEGILPPGAPRLGCYFIPFCVPWVNTLFRENGVNLSFRTYYAATKKLIKETTNRDIFKMIAEQWLKMPGSVNIQYEVDLTFEIINQLGPDAMLHGFYNFDRWMGVHHKIMVKRIEEEMKIPHFYIEGDMWDDRTHRREDLKARIECFSHFLKMYKMMS